MAVPSQNPATSTRQDERSRPPQDSDPPPVYFLAAIIVMVCLHLLLPGAQLIQSPLRYAALILVVAAIALVLWAAGLFRKAETAIKPFQESSALVVRGPFYAQPDVRRACVRTTRNRSAPRIRVSVRRRALVRGAESICDSSVPRKRSSSGPSARRTRTTGHVFGGGYSLSRRAVNGRQEARSMIGARRGQLGAVTILGIVLTATSGFVPTGAGAPAAPTPSDDEPGSDSR